MTDESIEVSEPEDKVVKAGDSDSNESALAEQRMKLFENSKLEKLRVHALIRDDDRREYLHDKESGLCSRDVHRERHTGAERQWMINKATMKNLTARVQFMEWYSRRRQHEMLMQ